LHNVQPTEVKRDRRPKASLEDSKRDTGRDKATEVECCGLKICMISDYESTKYNNEIANRQEVAKELRITLRKIWIFEEVAGSLIDKDVARGIVHE